jgi:hypothetical protein
MEEVSKYRRTYVVEDVENDRGETNANKLKMLGVLEGE